MFITRRIAAITIAFSSLFAFEITANAQTYETYGDAVREANKHLRTRAYAKAEAPLEAALDLASSESEKRRTYRALLSCYRLHEDPAKMIEACEYIIVGSEQKAERSLTTRSLISFLHQRGKLDDEIERYKKDLAKTPDDIVALSILSKMDVVDRSKREIARDYQTQLEKVEQKKAAEIAKAHEVDAEKDPRKTAYYLREAASYWLQAGEKEKAISVAKKAIEQGPDNRSEILRYFWHRSIGETLLGAGEPKLAVEQLEEALKHTKIEGYKKSTTELIQKAKSAAAN